MACLPACGLDQPIAPPRLTVAAALHAALLAFGEERFHAQLGVTAVLHTWSQTLGDHYHLHCLVTGGGWDQEHGRWQSSGRRYLFPVQALSLVFRGKYLEGLQRLFERGE